jgi:hypothetical protein
VLAEARAVLAEHGPKAEARLGRLRHPRLALLIGRRIIIYGAARARRPQRASRQRRASPRPRVERSARAHLVFIVVIVLVATIATALGMKVSAIC